MVLAKDGLDRSRLGSHGMLAALFAIVLPVPRRRRSGAQNEKRGKWQAACGGESTAASIMCVRLGAAAADGAGDEVCSRRGELCWAVV